MCKRCSDLEIEIEAAEEYGFSFTSFQLQEELEALQASHLPNKVLQSDFAEECAYEAPCLHNGASVEQSWRARS